ncbi:MAG: trypsin-like peptidase domain-containing protein [Candidatus Babeliaceae bacterium]|nr:trypsin-like peptidase domain-containing protein [Candidatus Babeliaceae bacterium]
MMKWKRSILAALVVLAAGCKNTVIEAKGKTKANNTAPENYIARLIEEKANAVGQVYVEHAQKDILEPYLSPRQTLSLGSCFIYTKDGKVITNAHVVDSAAEYGITMQLQRFGKRRFDLKLLYVWPDADLALLQIAPDDLAFLKKELGDIPILEFGDSDQVHRADQIFTLGYPLGQDALKSTRGIVSGPQHVDDMFFIQIDAAINPGNSGGPSLNRQGKVIGINSAGIQEKGTQNVGYIIPINMVKLFLRQYDIAATYKDIRVLRKPFMGIIFCGTSENVAEFLGNPKPGGLYIIETLPDSPLATAGMKPGDMIYEINGLRVDSFGELKAPWSEDRVSIIDYVARLGVGEDIKLIIYRHGKQIQLETTLKLTIPPGIRVIFPAYEDLDYEIIGGFVIMGLTLNHIPILAKVEPRLTHYMEYEKQIEPTLVITHIFPASAASRSRSLHAGCIIKEVNGQKVTTLSGFRNAIASSKSTFLSIKTDIGVLVALPMQKILNEEQKLSQLYFYKMTPFMQKLIEDRLYAPEEKKA